MSNVKAELKEGVMTVSVSGNVDSSNAPDTEKEIRDALGNQQFNELILDAEDLNYISSAGLRIILRLKKDYSEFKVTNVRSEVYEILEMTGFTEMMTIEKAYRKFSVDGCEVIGQGANGTVYRYDADTIVKVYNKYSSLDDIKREREMARKALILGIPTAIPYDVVKVGENFGSVFELLNADSFAKLLINGTYTMDEIVDMDVELIKKIHATEVKEGDMPSMKAVAVDWVDFLRD
ncbi:MAG: anti-sigma factor antagonist, partial [Erysipelotrichaceae bacterium]|nr:anti-sigma factor antagonist [Erysipelotrichaceae bacterium]